MLSQRDHASELVGLQRHCHDAPLALSSIPLVDCENHSLALLEHVGTALLGESDALRTTRTVSATKSQARTQACYAIGGAPTHLKQRLVLAQPQGRVPERSGGAPIAVATLLKNAQ